jgi:hypothetical protein
MIISILGWTGRSAAKKAFKQWNNYNKQRTRYASWSYNIALGEHDVAFYEKENN